MKRGLSVMDRINPFRRQGRPVFATGFGSRYSEDMYIASMDEEHTDDRVDRAEILERRQAGYRPVMRSGIGIVGWLR